MVAGSHAASVPADAVKGFLENPPEVSNVIFRFKAPGPTPVLALARDPKTGTFSPKKGATNQVQLAEWGVDSGGYRWYLARWEPGAFLLRQIDPAQTATSNKMTGFVSCGHLRTNL
jgi:hypothetical protein